MKEADLAGKGYFTDATGAQAIIFMLKLIKNKKLYFVTIFSIVLFSLMDLYKSIIFGDFFNTLDNGIIYKTNLIMS